MITPLIGRQAELKELQVQLLNPENRLVTILGPGGSGKSRLALEVAQTVMNCFPEGVFFVSLNPIESTYSILSAIIDAINLSLVDIEDPKDQLINYLRDKKLLLLLDGFEHLLDEACWYQ